MLFLKPNCFVCSIYTTGLLVYDLDLTGKFCHLVSSVLSRTDTVNATIWRLFPAFIGLGRPRVLLLLLFRALAGT